MENRRFTSEVKPLSDLELKRIDAWLIQERERKKELDRGIKVIKDEKEWDGVYPDKYGKFR